MRLSFHPSICLSTGGGGVPMSHNALQHFPECHGADTGGVPISHNALQHFPECHGADTRGRYPYPIMLCNITQNSMGQTPRGGTLPGQDGGVPCQGVGYPQQGKPPWQGTPPMPGQDGGGTQLGQQKEYSLHGRQYASCVHAGGLSCSACYHRTKVHSEMNS